MTTICDHRGDARHTCCRLPRRHACRQHRCDCVATVAAFARSLQRLRELDNDKGADQFGNVVRVCETCPQHTGLISAEIPRKATP